MVLSSAIVCDRDRRIADDRRSMFSYDRRRSQTLLPSAIRDHMVTSLKTAIILNNYKAVSYCKVKLRNDMV